jgi:hypothetical protein
MVFFIYIKTVLGMMVGNLNKSFATIPKALRYKVLYIGEKNQKGRPVASNCRSQSNEICLQFLLFEPLVRGDKRCGLLT